MQKHGFVRGAKYLHTRDISNNKKALFLWGGGGARAHPHPRPRSYDPGCISFSDKLQSYTKNSLQLQQLKFIYTTVYYFKVL